jgi:predicted LPLAT superfamily acyltransferase
VPFLIYRHYFVFGQTIIDKLAVMAGTASSKITNANIENAAGTGTVNVETTGNGQLKFHVPQYDEFMNLVNKNIGFIIVGAHVGCWELASCFFKGYEDRINIVMMDAEYKKIKNITSHNKRPYKIIPASNDFLQTILSIRSALERNETVSFQGDRFIQGQSTFTADFMGYSATFPAGIFALIRKLRVPVVFIFVMRQRKLTYKIEFVFANSENSPTNDSANDSLEKQYIYALESIVRRYPQQWFNFYKFWN